MTEIETVTEVSTPVETIAEDTSTDVVPETSDTTTQEPEAVEVAAETETETKEEVKLYADKYKSIEEFEKGYKSLQSDYTKAKEFETKYNGLLKAQQEIEEKNRQLQFHNANQRGFRTPEEAEVSDRVQLAEFNFYWQKSSDVSPEYMQEVQKLLSSYYQTGNKGYLEEAKRYYTSDFIEDVAIAKKSIESNLKTEFRKKQSEAREKAQVELANTLKENFSEFLGDLQQNTGKAKALEMFCKADFINSVEDMKAFEFVYSEIEKHVKDKTLKEIEAQKVINETKEKAIIGNAKNEFLLSDDKAPTYSDIENMSQEQFNAAVDKYGLEKIIKAK